MIKPIWFKEAIQIEITNKCYRSCSNCTRLVDINPQYEMPLEMISNVMDAVRDFPGIIGIMGGEPLMHPEFEKICGLIKEKGLKDKMGLWSGFPKKYAYFGRLISESFDKVFPNDHSRVIMHAPILVSSKNFDHRELMKSCWVQLSWSASVNPQGAYFCEIAAALDLTLKTGTQWNPLSDWFKKTPDEYYEQIDALCSRCGVCLNMQPRKDSDEIYDIDTFWFKKMQEGKVKKYQEKKYNIVDPLSGPPIEDMNSFRKDIQYLVKPLRPYNLAIRLTPSGYMRPVWNQE